MNIQERKNKDGKITSYRIRVFDHRDAQTGKQVFRTLSVKYDDTKSAAWNKKNSEKQAVIFEKGIYDTDEYKELIRNDRLWQLHCLDEKEKTITIKNNGLFNVQNMKLYGREANGVDANGEFILGDWEQLNTAGNDMFIGTKRDITVNGKYVEFAFTYDITWGTDFPYSGVFWTNNYAYNDYDEIFINITGTCRNANIRIWVGENKKVVDQSNCSAHSEWKP